MFIIFVRIVYARKYIVQINLNLTHSLQLNLNNIQTKQWNLTKIKK